MADRIDYSGNLIPPFNKFAVMSELCRYLHNHYENNSLHFLLHKSGEIFIYRGTVLNEFATIECLRGNEGNHFLRIKHSAQTMRSKTVIIPQND